MAAKRPQPAADTAKTTLTHVENTLDPIIFPTLAYCFWDPCLVPSPEKLVFTLATLRIDSGA